MSNLIAAIIHILTFVSDQLNIAKYGTIINYFFEFEDMITGSRHMADKNKIRRKPQRFEKRKENETESENDSELDKNGLPLILNDLKLADPRLDKMEELIINLKEEILDKQRTIVRFTNEIQRMKSVFEKLMNLEREKKMAERRLQEEVVHLNYIFKINF